MTINKFNVALKETPTRSLGMANVTLANSPGVNPVPPSSRSLLRKTSGDTFVLSSVHGTSWVQQEKWPSGDVIVLLTTSYAPGVSGSSSRTP